MSEDFDPREFAADMAEQIKPLKEGLERVASTLTPLLQNAVTAWDTACVQEVAGHPDLAELNVQMDGWYGDGPVRPDEEPT